MSIISPPFSGSFVVIPAPPNGGPAGYVGTIGCNIYQLGNIIMIRFTGSVFGNGATPSADVANGAALTYPALPANFRPNVATTFLFPWRISVAPGAVASNTTGRISIGINGVMTLSVPTGSIFAADTVNAGAIGPSPVFTYCLSGL